MGMKYSYTTRTNNACYVNTCKRTAAPPMIAIIAILCLGAFGLDCSASLVEDTDTLLKNRVKV